ncbi:MAG: hypothetical protein HC817_01845 [Saprospiraceae bacterium]|nr:hypothetical protein [Saprospiraceae bacterium]
MTGFVWVMLLVTLKHATVWTDSRYFLQCEKELVGSDFELRKQKLQGAPEHVEWLCNSLSEGRIVACDGRLFSLDQVRYMEKIFAAKILNLRRIPTSLPLFGLTDLFWQPNLFLNTMPNLSDARARKKLLLLEKK